MQSLFLFWYLSGAFGAPEQGRFPAYVILATFPDLGYNRDTKHEKGELYGTDLARSEH